MPEEPEGHRTHSKRSPISYTERPALSPDCRRLPWEPHSHLTAEHRFKGPKQVSETGLCWACPRPVQKPSSALPAGSQPTDPASGRRIPALLLCFAASWASSQGLRRRPRLQSGPASNIQAPPSHCQSTPPLAWLFSTRSLSCSGSLTNTPFLVGQRLVGGLKV